MYYLDKNIFLKDDLHVLFISFFSKIYNKKKKLPPYDPLKSLGLIQNNQWSVFINFCQVFGNWTITIGYQWAVNGL